MRYLAVAFALLLTGMAKKPEPRTIMTEQREWKGQNCGVAGEKAVVIESEAEWKQVWVEAFGDSQPVPQIDFSNSVAAAVFAGTRRTGGFGVELTEAAPGVADYRIKSPPPGAFVTMAFTAPYAIKVFPGKRLELRRSK